jgi:N-acyl-L-homoserine lactone synthetase
MLFGGMAVAVSAAMDTLPTTHIATTPADDALLGGLLQGFRFRVCADRESVSKALAVRHAVYVEEGGYDIPVPDQYDFWSWLLIAEDLATGEVVGTMRLTPRTEGPLETEEYFRLPRRLRTGKTVEMNRFAILPAYRKGKTFLPIVSLGLFKLAKEVTEQAGMDWGVLCAKAERVWTYTWLGFESTGLKARYAKLHDIEHEVLSFDVSCVDETFGDNPLAAFFVATDHPEIELPATLPPVGLVDPALADRVLLKQSA